MKSRREQQLEKKRATYKWAQAREWIGADLRDNSEISFSAKLSVSSLLWRMRHFGREKP